jgi:hypothetical protein
LEGFDRSNIGAAGAADNRAKPLSVRDYQEDQDYKKRNLYPLPEINTEKTL